MVSDRIVSYRIGSVRFGLLCFGLAQFALAWLAGCEVTDIFDAHTTLSFVSDTHTEREREGRKGARKVNHFAAGLT